MNDQGEGSPAGELRVDGMREAFRWDLGAGFALGLGTALIVFVAAIVVTQ